MLLICIAGTVAVGFGGDAEPEATLLKGRWQMIDERLDKIGMVIVWEFTGTEVVVRNEKTGEEVSRSRYTIDAAKSPKWITVDVDDSPTEDTGDRRLGIFRIQGGELHLKQEITDGGDRPAKFEGRFSRFQRPTRQKQAEQEQGSAGQSTTRSESDSEGCNKAQPESKGRSR